MIKRLALNFKLGITKEKITPRSGIAIYAQVLKSLDMDSMVDKYIPLLILRFKQGADKSK